MDLFLDKYSILSFVTAFISMSITVGLIILFFFRLESIYTNKKRLKSNRARVAFYNTNPDVYIQQRWLAKKYEFMFGDFKQKTTNQFFFGYWMITFDVVYILLILSLQSVPLLQSLSIVIWVLSFILFSAMIKPFKKNSSAFLHFFNFSCVLIAAVPVFYH